MLTYRKDGDILEVTETTMSFTSDSKSYWYYDINSWFKSSTGKRNAPCDRKMSESDKAWVEKYYLAKMLELA
jgi:hypothetical protein